MKDQVAPPADESPERTKSCVDGMRDSSRWDHYSPREGDVIVATYPKCGTTWVEHIVVNLVHHGGGVPVVTDVSPWVELHFRRDEWGVEVPIEEIMAQFDAQTHQRMMKTHLPLDCLPYHQESLYVIVGRDARDACMSMFNHQKALGWLAEDHGIRDYWTEWISAAADENTPAHPLFDYYEQWWGFRHLKNVLLVHYSDLKADPSGEITRLAHFLGIGATEELIDSVRDATDFSSMKANERKLVPSLVERFKEGGRSFLNQGTNGRWRDALTEDDLSLYDPVAARSASPECREWIERGGMLSG